MRFNIQFFIISILLTVSCKEKKSNQQPALPEIIIKEVMVAYDNCNPDSINCTYVHIAYPEFTDSTQISINEVMARKLKKIALNYFREEVIEGTYEYIAQSFIHDYEAFKMDFTDYGFGWYVKLFSEIIYESDQLISLRVYSESFTGGAHPNSSTSFFVISKQTLNDLTTSDIISDTVRFKKMLENEFRNEKGMRVDQSFADRGFYINDGDFLLNNNIGLSDAGIIVHFNPYEIAPYSEGATTLVLGIEQLGNMLRVEY